MGVVPYFGLDGWFLRNPPFGSGVADWDGVPHLGLTNFIPICLYFVANLRNLYSSGVQGSLGSSFFFEPDDFFVEPEDFFFEVFLLHFSSVSPLQHLPNRTHERPHNLDLAGLQLGRPRGAPGARGSLGVLHLGLHEPAEVGVFLHSLLFFEQLGVLRVPAIARNFYELLTQLIT